MFWQEVHQLDQQLTLTINSWHSAFTDPIWAFFSNKVVWIPMYAAIVALLIWKLGWKKGLMVVAAAVLTFGFWSRHFFRPVNVLQASPNAFAACAEKKL